MAGEPGWLGTYLSYTQQWHFSREWNLACGMALVGLATMDRMEFASGPWEVIPYIHPFLIGPSGSGKGAVTKFMRRVQKSALPGLSVISSVASVAGIVKEIKDGVPTLILAEEATTLMGNEKWQAGIVPNLTELADCDDYGKTLKNERVQLNRVRVSIVLGSNEKALREDFDKNVVEKGIATRFVWLVSGMPIVGADEPDESSEESVRFFTKSCEGLRSIASMRGPCGLADSGRAAYRLWHDSYRNERPEDEVMTGWYSRRNMHVLRVALIAALADGQLEIDAGHFDWAWGFIQSAEAQMKVAFQSISMSNYGKEEDKVYRWMAGKREWLTTSAIKQRWAAQMPRGCASVTFILDSLRERGKILADPECGGRGARYMVPGE